MRTVSRAGHVYDLDLVQVGSCVFIAFLSVRRERIGLNDPLVKVQVTEAERLDLKSRIERMGSLHRCESDWQLSSLCGIPIEVIGDPPASLSVLQRLTSVYDRDTARPLCDAMSPEARSDADSAD